MAIRNKTIEDYSFYVYWDTYEGMWAAECTSILLGRNRYLKDLGDTPEGAVSNFIYLLKLHINKCLEDQEEK